MTLKTGLFAITASVATLLISGCTSMFESLTPEQTQGAVNYYTTYNPSHSYAWNIMKLGSFCTDQGAFTGIADTYISDDQYKALSKAANPGTGQALLGDAVVGSALAATGAISSWTAPKLSLLSLLVVGGDHEYKPTIIGFVPAKHAENYDTAAAKHNENIIHAYSEALKELGFTNIAVDEKKTITAQRPSTNASVKIRTSHGFVNRYEFFETLGAGWKTNVPNWIDKTQPEAWGFGTFTTPPNLEENIFEVSDDGGNIFNPNKSIALKLELMDKFAAHLPDNYFVYVPSYERSYVNRNEKYTPHYVANNKGKFYFVMPESAKKQEQPKSK